jgi:uncharacterized RDD family membrane protein YckC
MTTQFAASPHPGIRRQVFAFGYEIITTVTILFSIGFLVTALFGGSGTASSKIITNVFPILLVALYYALCWNKTGQSLAQKAWGLKVAEKNGDLLSTSKSFKRVLLAGAFNLTGFSIIFLLFSKNHQPLQDQFLGTVVVLSNA